MAFDIQEEDLSGFKLLRLSGRLDKESADGLASRLDSLDEVTVLIDLGALVYLSSAGIQTLLSAAQKRKRDGKLLALSSVRPELRQVMEEAGYGDTLKLYADLGAATKALGTAPRHPLSDEAARLLGAPIATMAVNASADMHELAQRASSILGPSKPETKPAREPLKETAMNSPALPPSLPEDQPEPPPLPQAELVPAVGVIGRFKGMFGR